MWSEGRTPCASFSATSFRSFLREILGIGAALIRQQIAVFRVEHKQQPVEQQQRAFADIIECRGIEFGGRFAIGDRERLRESGEHIAEDGVGQIAGDARFPLLALAECKLMERFAAMVGQECGSAKEQQEQPETVRAPCGIVEERFRTPVEQIGFASRQVEHLAEVDLEEVFRDRERAFEVQPPMPAIGEHPPPQAAVGHVIDAAQVAQHLRRGHAAIRAVMRLIAIEWPVPALRLDHARAMLESLPRWKRRGQSLPCGVAKQQGIGNVVARLG